MSIWSKLGDMMILNQEVKKWATDLHIFLHKAEMFLPSSNSAEEFVGKVFSSFEEKPQFLSNEEAEEMLHEIVASLQRWTPRLGSPALYYF
jgi:hypothetical protein